MLLSVTENFESLGADPQRNQADIEPGESAEHTSHQSPRTASEALAGNGFLHACGKDFAAYQYARFGDGSGITDFVERQSVPFHLGALYGVVASHFCELAGLVLAAEVAADSFSAGGSSMMREI